MKTPTVLEKDDRIPAYIMIIIAVVLLYFTAKYL